MTIKVLVVDDSLFMRKLISDMLESDPDIKVIDTARNGEDCLDKLKTLKPDVITLDLIMPGKGGLETLKEIMAEHPIPTIMFSAYTSKDADITIKCLDKGAVGFVLKPSGAVSLDVAKVREELLKEIKIAVTVSVRKIKSLLGKKPTKHAIKPSAVILDKVIAIGSSTGGPAALELLLPEFPFNIPAGILIVQHMPAKFTKSLAERLDTMADIEIKEAEEGDVVEAGKAYIAPGDFHMIVEKKQVEGSIKAVISLTKNPPVKHLRPSVDVTLESVADVYGENAVGVILTGMGDDGTDGMHAIKAKNGKTIAQDEDSSLIFGMPKQVIRNGDADYTVSLFGISKKILELL